MKKQIIHYVPHTHWDKEWYKTYEEFRVKFIKYFREILDVLEHNDNFDHFMFDAQSSIIDDYLEIYPNERKRLKKLIGSKKLLVGPWYTLPDNYLSNGESLVRNLLIGSNLSDEFGHNQNICYIPDSFGQCDQMPQIIEDANLKGAVVWRGIDSTMTNDAAFIWEGSNGSQILSLHLPLGYGFCKKLPSDNNTQTYVDDIVKRLSTKYNGNNVLFMGGSDHEGIQPELPEILKKINNFYSQNKIDKKIIISSLDDFFGSYMMEKNIKELTTLTGELRSSRDQRIHYGDASSRADIKKINRELENKISTILEPILSINLSKFDNEYSNELINYCWKLMFENQAHDSICTTCTDPTHREIITRFEKVNQTINELINYSNKNILESLDIEDNLQYFVVYNTKINSLKGSYEEITIDSEYKNFVLFDYLKNKIEFEVLYQYEIDKVHTNIDYCNYISMLEAAEDFKNLNKGKKFNNISKKAYRTKILIKSDLINNLSYKFFYLKNSDDTIVNNDWKENNNFSFENDFYKAEVNKNGTLKILNKSNNEIYDNLFYLESRGDAGDSFDYSPPKYDKIFNTLNLKPEIRVQYSSDKYKNILVIYKWPLPNKLMNNDTIRSKNLVKNSVTIKYTFFSHKKTVDVDVNFDNKSIEHFVTINCNLNSEFEHSVAGQQFGNIKRKNFLENEPNWKETHRSMQYPLYPFERFVSIFDKNNRGIMINTFDSSEYKISQNKELRISLFRSFGYLGKANLEFRPGRPSGIYWKTPDSYLNKKMKFYFQLNIFNGEKEFDDAVSYSDFYFNKLKCFEIIKDIFYKKRNTFKYDENSFVTVNNKNVKLSTLKLSEKKDGYILRIYNTSNKDLKNIELDFNKKYNIYLSNIFEEEFQFLGNKNKVLLKELKYNQFITLKVKF